MSISTPRLFTSNAVGTIVGTADIVATTQPLQTTLSITTLSYAVISGVVTYTSNTAAIAGEVTATSTASATESTNSSDGNRGGNEGGLGTAAAAGVGVGATLGAVCLISILFIAWRRWRATSRARKDSPPDYPGFVYAEMAHSDSSPPPVPPQNGAQRLEAPGTASLAEADGDGVLELDGGEKAVEVAGDWKAVEAADGRRTVDEPKELEAGKSLHV